MTDHGVAGRAVVHCGNEGVGLYMAMRLLRGMMMVMMMMRLILQLLLLLVPHQVVYMKDRMRQINRHVGLVVYLSQLVKERKHMNLPLDWYEWGWRLSSVGRELQGWCCVMMVGQALWVVVVLVVVVAVVVVTKVMTPWWVEVVVVSVE